MADGLLWNNKMVNYICESVESDDSVNAMEMG